MKKILIVSFYELKEYLLSISNIFINTYKWDVCNYPLFMYYKDENTKIDNYKEHFSAFIDENKPDIILWWYYGIPIDIIQYIQFKHPKIYYIIYEYSNDTNDKLSLFDYILSSNKNKINYFLFGYDKLLYKKNTNKYIYDVSIYCDDIINNKDDILKIEKYCIENDLKFIQYGSKKLCSLYGDNYSYYDLPDKLNSSKINIVSENNLSGSLSCNENTILFDDNIIDNIENNNFIKLEFDYSWDEFVKLIFINYIKKIFDYDFYVNTYKLDITNKELIYKYWEDKLLLKNIIDIPYKIIIPDNFDLDNYKKLFKIDFSDEYYYIQWFMCGKDKSFIKSVKSNFILGSDNYNIQSNKILDLFYGFNLFSNPNTIYDGLDILDKISKNNPYLEINELVKMYNTINN